MTRLRNCPVCGKATRGGDRWDSFWTGATICDVCHASLQLRSGWIGKVVQAALLFAVAAPVYLATRGLPDLWAVVGFLLVFAPLSVGCTALLQWYRWRHAALDARDRQQERAPDAPKTR